MKAIHKRNIYLGLFAAFLFATGCRQPVETVAEPEPTTVGRDDLLQNLMPLIQIKGQPARTFTLAERMEYHQVPGVSIAFFENGQLSWASGFGVANTETARPVTAQTLFQAGSISKPVAALAALKLAEEGRIELDTDVNRYLTSWKLQENDFNSTEKVTMRRLLTHTAGLTVHGFPGYESDQPIPSTNDVLNGSGNTPPIVNDTVPGSRWRYSGGGYTVMQKVVEDVTGEPFESYLQRAVLAPIGMSSSTYEQPLPEASRELASAAFDGSGNMAGGLWNNYPEKAAAGLWTTPSDLVSYLIEIQEALAGRSQKVLGREMVEAMLTKHENDWGLGPNLNLDGDSLTFGHGGKNRGFTNNMIAFAHRGTGIVVMTNGDSGGPLIGEVFRGAAHLYNWSIAQPRLIEKHKIAENARSTYLGKYTAEIPGFGTYRVDIRLGKDEFEIYDQIENSIQYFIPVTPLVFIDRDSGDEVKFGQGPDGKITSFVYNGDITFIKEN